MEKFVPISAKVARGFVDQVDRPVIDNFWYTFDLKIHKAIEQHLESIAIKIYCYELINNVDQLVEQIKLLGYSCTKSNNVDQLVEQIKLLGYSCTKSNVVFSCVTDIQETDYKGDFTDRCPTNEQYIILTIGW